MHTTDSPWFWLLLFSGMALVALLAMERRYGARQSQIERQYQGRAHALRQRMASDGANNGANERGEVDERPPSLSTEFSTPDDTVIELTPLRYLALAVLLAAAAGFAWERRRNRQLAGGRAP